MSGTTVALIATSTIAVGGYLFNYLSSSRDRRAARALAQDAQKHEKAMRQGDRQYAARESTYRLIAEWALRSIQRLELTDPILTTNLTPEPPESLSKEHFDKMHVELALHGTSAVEAAVDAFRETECQFYSAGTRRCKRQRGSDILRPST